MKKINIIFAGEGGQGIQSLAKILSQAAVTTGLEATYMPSFGVEQRGAPSVAFVTIDDKPIRYPKFDVADLAVILQSRAVESIEKYISPNTNIIFDSSTISEKDFPLRFNHLNGIPATKISAEKHNFKLLNIIILGAVSKYLELDENVVFSQLKHILSSKLRNEKLYKDAYMLGRDVVFEKKNFSDAVYKTKHKTVVYKGHNKTAKVIPQRCKGCLICVSKCPVGAISLSDDFGLFGTPVPKIDLEKCIACGNCKNFCPDSAIGVEKNK